MNQPNCEKCGHYYRWHFEYDHLPSGRTGCGAMDCDCTLYRPASDSTESLTDDEWIEFYNKSKQEGKVDGVFFRLASQGILPDGVDENDARVVRIIAELSASDSTEGQGEDEVLAEKALEYRHAAEVMIAAFDNRPENEPFSFGQITRECALKCTMIDVGWPVPDELQACDGSYLRDPQLTATRTALEDCLNALDTLPPDIFGTASVSSASDEGTNWYIRDELIGRGRAAISKAKEIGKEEVKS